MRFISQFENTYEIVRHPMYKNALQAHKSRGESELGDLIGKAFGWDEQGHRFNIRHTLDIEAFPMEKWRDFKLNLYELLRNTPAEAKHEIIKLVKELESHGG